MWASQHSAKWRHSSLFLLYLWCASGHVGILDSSLNAAGWCEERKLARGQEGLPFSAMLRAVLRFYANALLSWLKPDLPSFCGQVMVMGWGKSGRHAAVYPGCAQWPAPGQDQPDARGVTQHTLNLVKECKWTQSKLTAKCCGVQVSEFWSDHYVLKVCTIWTGSQGFVQVSTIKVNCQLR